ncbi:MAG: carbohydrate ABC transporter permease [Chthoniobacteraceae bacterium]
MKGRLWHIPLLLASLAMLLPVAFMFTTALSMPGQAFQFTQSLRALFIPSAWHWQNFLEVWEKVSFLRYYVNSLVVASIVTAGQVFTSACAAYAFARLRWPGRDKIFLAYLATMMVPGSVTMLPNFISMKMAPDFLSAVLPVIDWHSLRYLGTSAHAPLVGRLAGLDSYFALIAPGMFSAYGTFLLRQFLLSIPRELEEAAQIDGCGYWKTFSVVVLPLAKPGLATLSVFTFMGSWGNFLWPLVSINLDSMRTLPLGLQAFQGQYTAEWHLLMAGAILMLLPIVALFLFCQRYFISGLALGGVKG